MRKSSIYIGIISGLLISFIANFMLELEFPSLSWFSFVIIGNIVLILLLNMVRDTFDF